jgi:hypothetical protein
MNKLQIIIFQCKLLPVWFHQFSFSWQFSDYLKFVHIIWCRFYFSIFKSLYTVSKCFIKYVMRRKISWTDGRTEVKHFNSIPPSPFRERGYKNHKMGTCDNYNRACFIVYNLLGWFEFSSNIFNKTFWNEPVRFLFPVCRLSWFLYILNIYAHFSSHFPQQLLKAEIWYLVTSFI